MKGFKLEASDAMSIVDKFTALDLQAATTAGEIAEGLSQFANVATLNGVTIDQAAAMVATIADVTQQSGSAVGSSLKMMMSRYSNVKSGAFTSEDGDNEKLNDTEKVLSKLGISMRDTNMQFRAFGDVLADIADRWSDLDNISQNAIAGAIAGTRQRESFVTLLSNYDKYQDLLSVSENSSGTARKKYLSYQEQLEAQQKKLQAAWEKFANSADVQRLLIDVNKIATALVKFLPTFTKYVGRYVAISQAYKIPNAVRSFSRFLMPGIGNSFSQGFGSGMKSFGSGVVSMFSGRAHNTTIEKYNTQTESKTWIAVLRENIMATRANTAALTGKPVSGGTIPGSGGVSLPAAGGVNPQGSTAYVGGAFDLNKIDLQKVRKFGFMDTVRGKGNVLQDFNNRDRSVAVVPIVDAKGRTTYQYQDASGHKQIISAQNYQTYQNRAQLQALKSYMNGSKGTPSQYQKDTAYLSQFKVGNDGKFHHVNADGSLGAAANGGQQKAIAKAQNNISNAQDAQAAKAAKTAGAVAIGFQAGVGALTGAMTASTTSKVDGVEYKMEDSTANWSRGSTAVIQGLGSTVSPALGSILGMGMDYAWTNWFGPLIEGAKINMEKRVAESQNKMQALSSLETDVATVKSLSKKSLWTAEDKRNNEAAIDSILEKMYTRDENGKDVNAGARKLLTDKLNAILGNQDKQVSLSEILVTQNEEDARKVAHALELAQAQAQTEALQGSYEAQFNQLASEGQDVYSNYREYTGLDKKDKDGALWSGVGAGLATALSGAGAGAGIGAAIGALGGPIGLVAGAKIGAVVGAIGGIFTGIATYKDVREAQEAKAAADWNRMGASGQIAEMEKYIAEERAKGVEADNELISQMQESVQVLREIRDQTQALNKKIDQAATAEALLGATYNGGFLSLMNQNQLKGMGVDEVKRTIADYLVETGGYRNSSVYLANGQLTTYANQLITSALKGSDQFSGVVSGKAYTLSEALGLGPFSSSGIVNQSNMDILRNFASALHVSIDELDQLEEKFGTLTLADFLMTATESINKLHEIGSLMTDIANSNKSWAETTHEIIEKYPALVQYLNNAQQLQKALWQQSARYAEIQIQGLFDDLAGSSGYFTESILPQIKNLSGYKNMIKDNGNIAQDFSGVNDLSSLMKWMNKYAGHDDIVGEIDELVAKELSKTTLVSDLMREQINTVLEYQEHLLQNEIDNLNDQKNALGEINKQREYENSLIEAKLKLENAMKEKKRVYREGVGWVYESDQAAIAEAQKNLSDVENQKIISELEMQITQLEADKAALEDIRNSETLEAQKAMYESWIETYTDDKGGVIGSINAFKAAITGDGFAENLASAMYEAEKKKAEEDKKEAIEKLKTSYADLQKVTLRSWDNATDAQKNTYNSALQDYQTKYNDAVSNGYIGADDFKSDVPAKNFGSVESKTVATDAMTQDIVPTAYVKSDTEGWYKLTMGPGKLSPDEIENIWGDWDEGGRRGQAWNEAYKGTGNASGASSAGYLESEYADLVDYADNHRNSWGLGDARDKSWFAVDSAGILHKVSAEKIDNSNLTKLLEAQSGSSVSNVYKNNKWEFAGGSLGAPGGMSLINELGTEALVTPSGTITSLPSGTGVVPADITRSLWQLGELSPLIANTLLGGVSGSDLGSKSYVNSNDESLNINSLIMNVSADNSFDVDAFANALRTRMALTKNNKR